MFSEQDEIEWRGEKVQLGEGHYTGTIDAVKMVISSKDGSKSLVVTYSTPQGSYDHFMRLETKGQKWHAKKELTKLGVNCECRLSELEDEVRKHIGQPVEFEIVKNPYNGKDYFNCSVLSGGSSGNNDVPF